MKHWQAWLEDGEGNIVEILAQGTQAHCDKFFKDNISRDVHIGYSLGTCIDNPEPWQLELWEFIEQHKGKRVQKIAAFNRLGTLINMHKQSIVNAAQLGKGVDKVQAVADHPTLKIEFPYWF